MTNCNLTFSLTKLSGSSLVENRHLVWTVRPLIELCYNRNSPVCLNRLRDLDVVIQPSVEDVILNLTSLSTTVFADNSRFAVKDLTTIDSYMLPDIIVTMLEYIQKETLNCNQLQCQYNLSKTNILPVRLRSSDTAEHYALVMPTQVLNVKSSDVNHYYPFLHPLIEKANNVVHLLSNIGVQGTLHFSHIRYILQLSKMKFQENKVDSDTLSIILKATQDLVKLLQYEQPEDDVVQHLKTLYLLNENCVLTECSRLVVHDISGLHKFPLPFEYAYLHPLGELHLGNALLHFLPKQLGLISLKSIIRYEMIDNKAAEDVFHCVSVIGEILKSSEFTKALLIFSNCCTHGTTPDSMTDILTKFQSSLTIQYLDAVDVKPYLKLHDGEITVSDKLSYSFFLEKFSDQQWTLSLKNTRSVYALPVFIKLAKQICSRLKLRSTGCFDVTDNDDLPDLAMFVSFVLQCDSVSGIASVIKRWLPGAHLEVTASTNDAVSDSTHAHNEHLVNLLLSEELIRNINEKGKDYTQILQTVMEWENTEPQIDLNEAKIWIQQAQYDHSALSTLIKATRTDGMNHFAAICFMCHQVAEKSLKAGVYAKCGMKPTGLRIHDLLYLTDELEKKGVSIISEIFSLNNLYLPTRYPNCHNPSAVPGDKFSTQLAERGYEIATRIFEAMQEMIGGANS